MIPEVDSISSVREQPRICEVFHRAAMTSSSRRRLWWSWLVLGSVCLGPGRALATDWVELATTPTGASKISFELIQITIKWVHSEASKQRTIDVRRQSRLSVEGYEDLAYSVSSPVLDCWGKQSRSMGFVDYNSSGNEIGRLAQTSTWVPWAQRSPNTPDQELCRRFSNR